MYAEYKSLRSANCEDQTLNSVTSRDLYTRISAQRVSEMAFSL